MCLAHKNAKEKAKLSGVSPKCVSSTKKRYEETSSVSDRSHSDRLENILHIVIKNLVILEKPHNSLLAYPNRLGLRIKIRGNDIKKLIAFSKS
ncbi:hypothetical protein BpHYR1_005645 [Brachionus plicatilis]|uniref:Uncharacterized protein n=1 Tax=Brachionus plicatilis TaxID=10195 RepID=A0A3M7SYM1_BRAPC|nr:hypothetical protein BpHYR1_005645 [Brachionus plicatilis]